MRGSGSHTCSRAINESVRGRRVDILPVPVVRETQGPTDLPTRPSHPRPWVVRGLRVRPVSPLFTSTDSGPGGYGRDPRLGPEAGRGPRRRASGPEEIGGATRGPRAPTVGVKGFVGGVPRDLRRDCSCTRPRPEPRHTGSCCLVHAVLGPDVPPPFTGLPASAPIPHTAAGRHSDRGAVAGVGPHWKGRRAGFRSFRPPRKFLRRRAAQATVLRGPPPPSPASSGLLAGGRRWVRAGRAVSERRG